MSEKNKKGKEKQQQKKKQKQLKKINTEIPQDNQKQMQKSNQQNNDQSETSNDTQANCADCSNCFKQQKVKWYFVAWICFILAFAVFVLIWVIGYFSIQRLTSDYYFKDYNISPYTSIQFWKNSKRATNSSTQAYSLSNSIYSADELKKPDAVALSLFFSWLMWKLPLTVFTLKIIRNKKDKKNRYTTYGFYLVLLLLIDILVTAFHPQGYQQWIFFIIYVGLSIILIVVNFFKKRKKLFRNIVNYMLPILYIVLTYVSFTLFIPSIYSSIYKGLGQDAPFVIVYIFPFIDLIFYSLIILITYFCQPHAIKFIKMFQFLNTGYIVGHLMLFSPDEVQFYFLITYFAIRNISTNWILQKVQKYVINPCPLPAWLIIYLVSLCVKFIPLIGVGKIVISISFYSQILSISLPLIRYSPINQYYIYSASGISQVPQFNTSLSSNTQLSAIFIIWVILTITQKYHISKVEIKEFFFYLFAIYLFYFGLATGNQLYYLQSNSLAN